MSSYLEWKKKAMLMGANVFYLPSGLARSKCLAAFQFKNAGSESAALMDLTGNGYNLTKYSQTYSSTTYTPSWSSSGFKFSAVYGGYSGYLNNSSLNSASIVSAVVCFTGVTQDNRAYLISAGGASGKVQIMAATSCYQFDSINSDYEIINPKYKNYGGPGFIANAYSSWSWTGRMAYYSSTYKSSGVIGVNFSSTAMYLDGTSVSLSYTPSGTTYCDLPNTYTFGTSHSSKSDLNNATHAGYTIIAAAFFSQELSADQHAEVANAMLAM